MSTVLSIGFWLLAGAVVFTTLSPLTNSVRWWVRAWDFPRIHIAAVALLVAAIGVFGLGGTATIAGAVMVACAIYQLVRVFPYTRFARREIEMVHADQSSSVLSVNVLMENTQYQRLRDVIDREDPDVLLLMETDKTWETELSPQLQRYSTVIRHPLDNHYGLIFATRLPTQDARFVFLSDADTPVVLATLDGVGGRFFFVGLHPRPPVPGNSTKDRDAQIARAATLADRTQLPVMAIGDFNDVAWSWSSERFKRHGGFRDPRVGRGMLPSFDAQSWWMRFPIDQLYLTEGLELVSFRRLEAVGSDHFPMHAQFVVNRKQDE